MTIVRRNQDRYDLKQNFGIKRASVMIKMDNLIKSENPEQRALVVFSGATDLKWLRVLRRGYRHCFALVQSDECWILYNPLSNGTEIEVWPGDQEENLRAWLVQNGYEVIDEVVRPLGRRTFPWAPFSCVEAVKRVLRVRAPSVFTPWQLYRFLKNNKKEKNP